jgi:hypothetical protein
MIRRLSVAAAALSLVPVLALAAPGDVVRTYAAPDAPIASSVLAPAGVDTLYVAGTTASPLAPAAPGTPPAYGTPDQPNRPARTTVQVAALAGPGQLVEIEAIAARRPAP